MMNGCNLAQTKVFAITSMPEPSCKKQVQSFIDTKIYDMNGAKRQTRIFLSSFSTLFYTF